MAEDKELKGIAKINAERKAAKEAAEKEKQAAAAAGAGGAPSETSPPAGDPPGGDPSPEFRGNGPTDLGGQTIPSETTADPSDENDPFVKLAKEYAPLYPENKVFHITSDKQVFLAKDKGLAQLHQRGKEGQLTTVKLD